MESYQDRYVDYEIYRKQIRDEKMDFLNEVKMSVEILQRKVKTKRDGALPLIDCAQPLGSVRKVLQEMDSIMADSINACYEGDKERFIKHLLDTDYLLQMLRETVYLELTELAQE